MYEGFLLNFEKISFEKQTAYRELLAETGTVASDYSFINLWGWADEYGLEWAWSDNVVWIRQNRPERINWAPLPRKEDVDWSLVIAMLQESKPSFTRVPSILMEKWKDYFTGAIEIKEARGHWDYIYSTKDLIELSGNRYHKKKNLLNQFIKKYKFEYIQDVSTILQQTKAMQESWCIWRDCESSEMLAAENRAIYRVLGSWDSLVNILGSAIMVDGNVVAFCIAEKFNPDTLIIHFEKGFTEFSGVYQAMNQMFLAANSSCQYVNREQDLDEQGLRIAKLSYNPVDFVRKYHVVVHF